MRSGAIARRQGRASQSQYEMSPPRTSGFTQQSSIVVAPIVALLQKLRPCTALCMEIADARGEVACGIVQARLSTAFPVTRFLGGERVEMGGNW